MVKELMSGCISLLLLATGFPFVSPAVVEDLYADAPDVIKFDSMEDYDRQVNQGNEVWALMFYTNEDCEGCMLLKDVYVKTATLTKGLFKLGAIDIKTQHGNDIAYHWKLEDLPHYLILGDDKSQAIVRNPQKIFEELLLAASSVIEARAEKIIGSSDEKAIHDQLRYDRKAKTKRNTASYSREKQKVTSVVQVIKEEEQFDEHVMENNNVVVAAFTSPGNEKSRKFRREFEDCASRLVGESVTAVWVNADRLPQVCKEFDVTRTPTVVIFPGGEKSAEKAYKYKGDRLSQEVTVAVIHEVDRTGKPKQVVQLTSHDVLMEHCSGYNHVCVIGVMPPLIETGVDGRNKYLAILKRIQTVFRGSTYSFLWFETGTQSDIEETFGIDFGLPALATYTLDRRAFSTMKGSFSDKGISKYLHGIAGGRNAVNLLPREFVVHSIDPWDGKTAPESTQEEEIPLSEIMDDWDFGDDGISGEKKEVPLPEVEDEPEPVILEAEPEDDDDDDDDFFRDEL